jgi:hypothetical protein
MGAVFADQFRAQSVNRSSPIALVLTRVYGNADAAQSAWFAGLRASPSPVSFECGSQGPDRSLANVVQIMSQTLSPDFTS